MRSTGDRSRFERYRDPRSGPFLDRFRFEKETGPGIFSVAADNIGYRDQRLFGQYTIPGKMRLSVEWNQIPQFLTANAHTPYSDPGTNDQRLPSGAQSAVQGGANFAATYDGLNLGTFDLRTRRDTLTVNMVYDATQNLDLNFNLSTASRSGAQPWSVNLGFTGAADVAAPVDTRTTNMDAGAQWANDCGMVRVSYDGSWFTNNQESLTIDSPFRATDIATGPASVRYALFPSNRSNTVNGAAAVNLPAHSRLSAAVAFGNWTQDEPLLPMTINSAIPASSAPLPRTTADADIRRITANISFVTRPANYVNVTARYRLYDFKDQTPDFVAQNLVEYDGSLEAGTAELVPAHFSNRYNTFEAEATITKLTTVSFSGGYRFENVSYSDREVGSTSDNAVFASVDSSTFGMVWLHGTFEHARRRAADFNSLALTDLPDSGEYPGLRRYDIADRDRDQAVAMVQVMPVANVAISGSVTAQRDNYPNQQLTSTDAFGLQNTNMQGYSIFFDATPRNTITVGAGYGFQLYKSSQQSRQVTTAPTVPPSGQQVNPLQDWTVSEDERVHFVSVSTELTNIFPKTAIRFTYDFHRSESPYTYALPAGSTLVSTVTLPAGTTYPVQLPPLTYRWHTLTADVRYFLRSNLAAGITYWFDKYTPTDAWSMGSAIEDKNAVPALLLLGYGFRPYTVNSVWFRGMYFF